MNRRVLLFEALVAMEVLTACPQQSPIPAHQSRPPDLIGTVTFVDNSSSEKRVTIEADPGDPILNGRGTDKVDISNLPRVIQGHRIKVGCLIRVWYDQSVPIIDTYPQIVVAKSVEVVRCR